MSHTTHTTNGIAYDRAGPGDDTPAVLLHAGVADRRMWDGVWVSLSSVRDTVRLDLRGFGESAQRPSGPLVPVSDVSSTLRELGIGRCHLVGASYGAGVAVETALTHPTLVSSLTLLAPGGTLMSDAAAQDADLQAFVHAERAALAAGDVDAAVEANLVTWVDGPHRRPSDVDPAVRALVGRMQRRAFEIQADWDDLEEDDLDPPALDRLGDIRVPTLVLEGALDLQVIRGTARVLSDAIAGATLVSWPDCAHLPSMERPGDVVTLLLEHWSGSA